jgi:hypothetical protein
MPILGRLGETGGLDVFGPEMLSGALDINRPSGVVQARRRLPIAHTRGGKYGEGWHNSGRMFTKQNTIRDFIASAEYPRSGRLSKTKSSPFNSTATGEWSDSEKKVLGCGFKMEK